MIIKVNHFYVVFLLRRNSSSSFKYIDVIFRKRICVCVNSGQNTSLNASLNSSGAGKLINFNKIKNIFGANTSLTTARRLSGNLRTSFSTGVTYRVIASIPRLIAEPENRESLAIKATEMLLGHDKVEAQSNDACKDSSDEDVIGGSKISLENSWSVFEDYARKIEAVDSLLRRDRSQQQAVACKLMGYIGELSKKEQRIFNEKQSPISIEISQSELSNKVGSLIF